MKPYKLHIETVQSGRSAINKIKDGKVYDVIFMDYMMPDMDGEETLRLIRALDTDYARHIPVIALSGKDGEDTEQFFLDKGFAAFIAKPLSADKVSAALEKYMGLESKPNEPPPEKKGEINIPGIDAKAALSLYDGDAELLESILRSFARNIPTQLNRIQRPTAEGLPDYAIDVHTIKGAASGIGAVTLSQQAAQLEQWALSGSLEDVLASNDAFSDDVRALIHAINMYKT
jgi:CheY-like chemotaxis protein/HPt (histidine-containing phosphotransfer) domain-containing protein